MRNFFEHQDRARRNTRLLIALMAIGVLAMGLAIYAMLIAFTHLSSGSAALLGARTLGPDVLIASLLGTGAVVGGASGYRVLSLRGGGGQIAEMLGGRLVSGGARDALEKRLLNVVEEMAIASGVPVPQVFVLESEQGINAFAAGFAPGDAAIAVTRGSLEKLTRDELQGVIAHEFSHVLNGDMRLNIRLMGIVFGIVCIGLLGRMMIRVGGSSRRSFGSRKRGSPGAALFVLGLGVLLVGLIGELCGKLIKAAVGRQREFLADASAVQFTRNPEGIAGALKKIGGWREGAQVGGAHAEEASHFFFGDIHRRLFAASVLATHPPLAERVRRIDPGFRGQFPEVPAGILDPADAEHGAPAAAAGFAAATPAQVVARVGAPGPHALACSRQLLDALPPALREAAHNPLSACAIVYGLLISERAEVAGVQRAQIETQSGSALVAETARWLALLRTLPRSSRLPLVELLAPALRELNRDQRAAFSRTVQGLIDADRSVSVFEYVLAETLRMRLADEDAPAHRTRVRHKSLVSVRAELALLLSLLAHAGATAEDGAERAFAAGAARLRGIALAVLPRSERLLTALAPALAELRALAPQLRAPLVDACAHTVLADHRVSEDEATLLRAVCDALDCPLPPQLVA